jgi:hypothetical protein
MRCRFAHVRVHLSPDRADGVDRIEHVKVIPTTVPPIEMFSHANQRIGVVFTFLYPNREPILLAAKGRSNVQRCLSDCRL